MIKNYFSTSTPSNATVGATSTKIASTKSNRIFLSLCNDSDEDIYISLGSAAVMNKGLRLNAQGGTITMSNTDAICVGDVYAICASGGKNILIIEA